MIFLEKLREHYVCTKIAILEAVSNKIAEQYPAFCLCIAGYFETYCGCRAHCQ